MVWLLQILRPRTAAATQSILADFPADISVVQGLFMKAAQPLLRHGSVEQAGLLWPFALRLRLNIATEAQKLSVLGFKVCTTTWGLHLLVPCFGYSFSPEIALNPTPTKIPTTFGTRTSETHKSNQEPSFGGLDPKP